MRKEVKKAMENIEGAIVILQSISSRESIPEKVRKKSSEVASTLQASLENMNSIVNTYTN